MLEENVWEKVMDGSILVRNKEVKSGKITWKGSWTGEMIVIIMWKYIWTFFINKIEVERVNQEKCLVEFAGYITLAGKQQWGVWCCLA